MILKNLPNPYPEEKEWVSILAFLCLAIVLSTVFGSYGVKDDFLRHAASSLFDFDYAKIYGDAYYFKHNYWYIYELFVSEVVLLFAEHENAALAFLFAMAALYPLSFPKQKLSIQKLVAFYIVVAMAMGYFSNLRPASLASILLVNALFMHFATDIAKKYVVIHAAIVAGIVIAIHHAFWIFLLPLATISIPLALISIAIGLFLWMYFTDGEWVVFEQAVASADRGLFEISELMFNPFALIGFLLLVAMYTKFKPPISLSFDSVKSAFRQKETWLLIVALYFLAPMNLRFETLALVLAWLYVLLLKIDHIRFDMGVARLVVFFLVLGAAAKLSLVTEKLSPYNNGDFSNMRISAVSMLDSFSVIGSAKKLPEYIEPSMEIGFNKNYVEAMGRIEGAKMNCEYLLNNKITHFIVEPDNFTPLDCLNYDGIHHKSLVFKVITTP